eukprot:112235-Hanusia_phi.AAC.1
MAPRQVAPSKPGPCLTLAPSATGSPRLRGGSGNSDLPRTDVKELEGGRKSPGWDEAARSQVDDAKSRLKRARLEGDIYEMIDASNFILETKLAMKLEQAKDRHRIELQGEDQNAIAAALNEVKRAEERMESVKAEGRLMLEAQQAKD